jgi:hypothetical protein
MTERKLPPEIAALLNSFRGGGRVASGEGHLLLKAFVSIKDPSMRSSIVELVQKIAAANVTKQ